MAQTITPRVTYRMTIARSAARALTETLPEAVAAAAFELIDGPLAQNPQRVGKGLHAPPDGPWAARRGQYRVIYEIDDDETRVVILQRTFALSGLITDEQIGAALGRTVVREDSGVPAVARARGSVGRWVRPPWLTPVTPWCL